MKAERRHELKTNTLAHGLEGLPEFGRRYGTKILLVVVAVLAIIAVVRYQARVARDARELAATSFAEARLNIGSLQNLGAIPDGTEAARRRKEVQDQASRAIQRVLDEGEAPALRAEALVARGDLNWYLATGPEVRGADTQPALRLPDKREDLLERARAAYESAARAEGATPLTVATARLGMAAVAEQRRQWDQARAQYEQVVADNATPEAFKNEARVRLDDLKEIAQPVLIGPPATAPAQPTTGPAATTTTTSTAPTTSTQPATDQALPDVEQPALAPEQPERPAGPNAPPAQDGGPATEAPKTDAKPENPAPAPEASPAPARAEQPQTDAPPAPPAPQEPGTPKQ